jgi:hypothetical protein
MGDGQKVGSRNVMPAQTGTHDTAMLGSQVHGVPAFAGMTQG